MIVNVVVNIINESGVFLKRNCKLLRKFDVYFQKFKLSITFDKK